MIVAFYNDVHSVQRVLIFVGLAWIVSQLWFYHASAHLVFSSLLTKMAQCKISVSSARHTHWLCLDSFGVCWLLWRIGSGVCNFFVESFNICFTKHHWFLALHIRKVGGWNLVFGQLCSSCVFGACLWSFIPWNHFARILNSAFGSITVIDDVFSCFVIFGEQSRPWLANLRIDRVISLVVIIAHEVESRRSCSLAESILHLLGLVHLSRIDLSCLLQTAFQNDKLKP